MLKILLAVASLALAVPAAGQTITDATVHATRATSASVSAVVHVDRLDAIVSAESPVAAAVVPHLTQDGGMSAHPIPVAVPGRRLTGHGYHLMMMGLTRPLRVGDQVPVTVRFRSGATVQTLAIVR